MDPQALVPRREFGVIAAPGAASIAEHEDALLVIHEGRSLREVRGRRAVLDRQACSRTITATNNPPGTPCDLGHDVGAEALHDLIECPRHGWQRAQLLKHLISPGDGFAAFHRLTVAENRS